MSGRTAVFLALSLGAACSSPPSLLSSADGGPPLRDGDLSLVRTARWPGGGLELTVRLDLSDQRLFSDRSSGLHVRDSVGETPAMARRVALGPGFTAILVQPALDPDQRQQQELAIREFIVDRPRAERIALYRWGKSGEQVVGFAGERSRLLASVSRALAPIDNIDDIAPPGQAIAATAEEVAKVGGKDLRVMRTLVVVSPVEYPSEALTTATLSVIGTDDSLVSQARQASRRIDALSALGHYAVTLCTATDPQAISIEFDDVQGTLAFSPPAPWPEALGQDCDPTTLGTGPQAVPEILSLEFTDEQRATYAQRIEGPSKADFDLSVRLFPEQDAIPATAHLRGKGTLGCERKSYTITLQGPGRHLFTDRYDDEMYLVAMCGDERYIQTNTGLAAMASQGLFGFEHRYVEVWLDGDLRGVYLLIEKVDDGLVRSDGRVAAVLRRRFSPPADSVEVEKSSGDPEEAEKRWNDIASELEGLSGDPLVSAAESYTDVDQLLDWVALMTALGNGDYVDEVWPSAREERAANGTINWYWNYTGWDTDDLFDDCHYSGKYAFVDDNQLTFCVEGTLEKILLEDPVGYAAYADRLQGILDRLTPEVFQEMIDATGNQLLPYFARAEICQVMVELLEDNPGTIDPDEAQRDIREQLELLSLRYQSNRALLLERLADYRSRSAQ